MIAADSSALIGPAGDLAAVLTAKAARAKRAASAPVKLLLYGVPGVGKSHLAASLARDLTGHHLAVEHVNGKDVTIELVREWCLELAYSGSLFADWTVKLVDELDQCSRDAQTLLLTYLDRLPPCRAFIATSNLQLDLLQERFQTRLQQFKVEPPSTEDIAAHLTGLHPRLARGIAEQIAVGSGGNVRAAMLDAESYLDAAAARAVRATTKGGRK
jgi:DNA polymerase III delta prime subunit